MSSRDTILNKLRQVAQPFEDFPAPAEKRHMVPIPSDTSVSALVTQFAEEARKIGCHVTIADSESDALEQVLDLLADDESVAAWDLSLIPLSSLADALETRGITVAEPRDATVRAGISGVDAGLAATGSLVLKSGAGQHRTVSLLPEIYVAVVKTDQIVVDLETWFARLRESGLEQFTQPASLTIVSGPSKTADIAQELVLGAHGPKEVHIVVVT